MAIFNDFNLNIVFIFNANNRYTLYHSRYCKTPELNGTSMEAHLIVRRDYLLKVFLRGGSYSVGGLIREWGFNRSFTELLLIKKKQMEIKRATYEIMKSC